MFEILFLAFAIMALLRLPREVRRMRERKRSTLPSGAGVPEWVVRFQAERCPISGRYLSYDFTGRLRRPDILYARR
jgi:hypothetical protein